MVGEVHWSTGSGRLNGPYPGHNEGTGEVGGWSGLAGGLCCGIGAAAGECDGEGGDEAGDKEDLGSCRRTSCSVGGVAAYGSDASPKEEL